MGDIIAFKITEKNKKISYCLTWGRIFDPVNADTYIEVLKLFLGKSKTISEIKICSPLSEASKENCFYESFFKMCQFKIPFGKEHTKWLSRMSTRIKMGKELGFLG